MGQILSWRITLEKSFTFNFALQKISFLSLLSPVFLLVTMGETSLSFDLNEVEAQSPTRHQSILDNRYKQSIRQVTDKYSVLEKVRIDLLQTNNANKIEYSDLEEKILAEINRARTNPQIDANWLEERKQYYDGILVKLLGEKAIRTNKGLNALEETREISDSLSNIPDSPLLLEKIHKGILEEGDSVIPNDGSLYDSYPLQGNAGDAFIISVESDEFDTFLAIMDAQGNVLQQNDDISDSNSNSRLKVTLPKDGVYSVIVNAYDQEGKGEYVLTVRR
jgi:hypothetical protein